ncbi:MAG: glycosyltransferase family 4 protein [Pseudomonadota bacterium]
MKLRPAAFAIPGDITTRTGGYIYERRLLESLRDTGRAVRHLQIGASFPNPTPQDMADLIAQLTALPEGTPVILDGFLSATIDTQALSRLSVLTVAMVHHPLALESGLTPERRDFLYRIERDNLGLVSHVLVPSPHTAQTLIERYGVPADHITIARPGTDRFETSGARAKPPLILSVGIQHPRKGHDILLRALAKLTSHDWKAVIVGTPYDAAYAKTLGMTRNALGLAERVQITGRVSDEMLKQLYGEASIFALATRYEGYGLVFDEALVAGLPIVSCRTGAVGDTVPEKAGLLVPPDDPSAFAEALGTVLTDHTHRRTMANAAARAGGSLPSWMDTAHLVGDVLDRL